MGIPKRVQNQTQQKYTPLKREDGALAIDDNDKMGRLAERITGNFYTPDKMGPEISIGQLTEALRGDLEHHPQGGNAKRESETFATTPENAQKEPPFSKIPYILRKLRQSSELKKINKESL